MIGKMGLGSLGERVVIKKNVPTSQQGLTYFNLGTNADNNTNDENPYQKKKLPYSDFDKTPQGSVAKSVALCFGKRTVKNMQGNYPVKDLFGFDKPEDACSLNYGAVELHCKTLDQAITLLYCIKNVHKAKVGLFDKKIGPIAPVLVRRDGKISVVISEASAENFFVNVLDYDDKFASKIRDLGKVQRKEQAGLLDTIEIAPNKNKVKNGKVKRNKIQHGKIKEDTVAWVRQPNGDAGVCSIPFGDSIPVSALMNVVERNKDNLLCRVNVKSWFNSELDKSNIQSVKVRKDGHGKGSFSIRQEGRLTEAQAASILVQQLSGAYTEKELQEEVNSLIKQCKIDFIKQCLEKLNDGSNLTYQETRALEQHVESLNDVEIEFLRSTAESIANGTLSSEKEKNEAYSNLLGILAPNAAKDQAALSDLKSRDVNRVCEGAFRIALQQKDVDPKKLMKSFIELMTSAPFNNDSNQQPTAPIGHYNNIGIALARLGAKEFKKDEQERLTKEAINFFSENKVLVDSKKEEDGKIRKISKDDAELYSGLIKTYPFACAFMVPALKDKGSYLVRTLDSSAPIFAKSAQYLKDNDKQFFKRFIEELELISYFKFDVALTIKHICCVNEKNDGILLSQLASNEKFIKCVSAFEQKMLLSYCQGAGHFYPNPELNQKFGEVLGEHAQTLGIYDKIRNSSFVMPSLCENIAPERYNTLNVQVESQVAKVGNTVSQPEEISQPERTEKSTKAGLLQRREATKSNLSGLVVSNVTNSNEAVTSSNEPAILVTATEKKEPANSGNRNSEHRAKFQAAQSHRQRVGNNFNAEATTTAENAKAEENTTASCSTANFVHAEANVVAENTTIESNTANVTNENNQLDNNNQQNIQQPVARGSHLNRRNARTGGSNQGQVRF
jgi:hypothetical protein